MNIDTILGITGTILGVLGLIFGYIFYRKSLRVKEPYYSIWSNNLIQDSIANMSGLEVIYKGHKVDNLTVSKVLFWNDGYDTIESEDIVSTDPLRIDSVSQILDGTVIKANNPSNQIIATVAANGASVHIAFDYLDKNDGAIIQVVHTGKSSSDLTLKGKLKGSSIHFYLSKSRRVTEITTVLLGLMFTAFFVILYLQSSIHLSARWLISTGTVLAMLFVLY